MYKAYSLIVIHFENVMFNNMIVDFFCQKSKNNKLNWCLFRTIKSESQNLTLLSI